MLLAVRATVHLADTGGHLRPGEVALVNPDRQVIKEYLAAGYLVALPQSQQPSEETKP